MHYKFKFATITALFNSGTRAAGQIEKETKVNKAAVAPSCARFFSA